MEIPDIPGWIDTLIGVVIGLLSVPIISRMFSRRERKSLDLQNAQAESNVGGAIIDNAAKVNEQWQTFANSLNKRIEELESDLAKAQEMIQQQNQRLAEYSKQVSTLEHKLKMAEARIEELQGGGA